MFVFEMCPQRVRRSVDLAAFGAGPRVRRSHAQQVLGPSTSSCNTNTRFISFKVQESSPRFIKEVLTFSYRVNK